jgi:hypothetical protein
VLNSDNRTDFTLDTQHTYTNLIDLGGEWQFELLLGSWELDTQKIEMADLMVVKQTFPDDGGLNQYEFNIQGTVLT